MRDRDLLHMFIDELAFLARVSLVPRPTMGRGLDRFFNFGLGSEFYWHACEIEIFVLEYEGKGRTFLPLGLNLNPVVLRMLWEAQLSGEFLTLIQSDTGAGLIDILRDSQ